MAPARAMPCKPELVDREEKSFTTLNVLFFNYNNVLAHLEAARRSDLAVSYR